MITPPTPLQRKEKDMLSGPLPVVLDQSAVTPEERKEEEIFSRQLVDRSLLHGPNRRLKELSLIVDVAWEFLKGFRALHFVGPCITVFGSARFDENHRYYQLARRMGLPVEALVAATNVNSPLPELFTTGQYNPRRARPTASISNCVRAPT